MFASLVLLWLAVFFLLFLFKSQRPKNFPPGPTVLPFVGNIFHVSLENPLKDFERVRKLMNCPFNLIFFLHFIHVYLEVVLSLMKSL